MATMEITISNRSKGSLVACEKFKISRALAQELIAKMEAMVVDLPGDHQQRSHRGRDTTQSPYPTFEELFSQRTVVGQ